MLMKEQYRVLYITCVFAYYANRDIMCIIIYYMPTPKNLTKNGCLSLN